jgi:hypothetical protein
MPGLNSRNYTLKKHLSKSISASYWQINIFYVLTHLKFNYHCILAIKEMESGFNNFLTYLKYERFES